VSLDSVARVPTSSIDLPEFARCLREVQSALEVGGSASAPVADWAEFLGDGYNPAAIAAALHASIEELDSARPHRRAGATINWSSMRTRGLLTRLPERLGRFSGRLAAATLTGELVDPDAGADRSAHLADAFELLHGICLDASQLSLRLVGDPWQLGRAPISAMFEWPDAMKWRVELFEAALESVWPASAANEHNTFLSRHVRLRDAAAAPKERRIRPTRSSGCSVQPCRSLRSPVFVFPLRRGSPRWLQRRRRLRRRGRRSRSVCRLQHPVTASTSPFQWLAPRSRDT
jgi:hypothetical protein